MSRLPATLVSAADVDAGSWSRPSTTAAVSAVSSAVRLVASQALLLGSTTTFGGSALRGATAKSAVGGLPGGMLESDEMLPALPGAVSASSSEVAAPFRRGLTTGERDGVVAAEAEDVFTAFRCPLVGRGLVSLAGLEVRVGLAADAPDRGAEVGVVIFGGM